MICPQCQCENLPDAVFCDRCGVRFETVCSHCGAPTRRGEFAIITAQPNKNAELSEA